MRYHPAIVAQAAASSAASARRALLLGVGTGEWLNEHIFGGSWPAIEVRREMLVEAVALMRELWSGETVDHRGRYFTAENARLFTDPPSDIEIIWAASGTESAAAAAEHADGLWSTSPEAEIVDAYRHAGGRGPVYGQITVCYARKREDAVKTALTVWPNAGVPGQLSQDLPTWSHFEQVAKLVTEEQIAERIPCGPDVDAIVELVDKYTKAGFDNIHFHQVGPDQKGFLSLWQSTLAGTLS